MRPIRFALALALLFVASSVRADWNQTPTKTADYWACGNDLVQCDPSGGNFTVLLPAGNTVQHGTCVGVTIWGHNPNGHKVTVIGLGVFPNTTLAGEVDENFETMCFYWDSNTQTWTLFLHTNN